jgi:hypothetical protein
MIAPLEQPGTPGWANRLLPHGLSLLHSPFALILCCLGLFTVTWDRFANFSVGGFNVKLPVVAFAAAFALTFVTKTSLPAAVDSRRRIVLWTIGLIVVAYGVGLAWAVNRPAALAQFGTLILGAVLPLLAITRVAARGRGASVTLLDAYVKGGIVASAAGVYQLAAFYTGLPQPFSYSGEGGGLGRISSFAYEPAYFGYYLILVLGAMAARDAMLHRPTPVLPAAVVFGALLLCNSRAVFFTLPLFILLGVRRHPVGLKRIIPAGLLVPIALAVVLAALLSPSTTSFVQERFWSVFDPTEATSNAPRLDQYEVIVDVIEDHPQGIGPGNLLDVGPKYGLRPSADATSNTLVANNIWLQSMLDGGVLLTLVQAFLILVVATFLLARAQSPVAYLAAAWITIVLVAGMLTSFFYDVRLWAALGLMLAVLTEVSERTPPPRLVEPGFSAGPQPASRT